MKFDLFFFYVNSSVIAGANIAIDLGYALIFIFLRWEIAGPLVSFAAACAATSRLSQAHKINGRASHSYLEKIFWDTTHCMSVVMKSMRIH